MTTLTKPAGANLLADSPANAPPPRSAFESAGECLELHLAIEQAQTNTAAWRAHLTAMEQIDQRRASLNGLLAAVAEANGFGEARSLLVTSVPSVRTAHVAALEFSDLKKHLIDSIRVASAALMRDLERTLTIMHEQRQIGLIEWVGNSSCFYHFFQFSTQEQVRERVEGNMHHRDHERRKFLTRHQHHLCDARAHVLPATSVPTPVRIQRLLAEVPSFLRGLVYVVGGTIISEQVDTQLVGTDRWTESRPLPVQAEDPAVVLDGFVLAGWSPEEVHQERRRHAPFWAEIALFFLLVVAVVSVLLSQGPDSVWESLRQVIRR